MSTIYIQEPPTSGKVLLETSVGDIDIELWSREAPKACRNFIQLCMEGYYDGTIFHRIVKGFIAQGGDPTGTGTGGESIYGHTFKDEFHTRLRFVRRGLVAMANAGKDDNGSQFFFTMAPSPELQNKHTVFGKVAGDTLYNMLKLEDGLVDHNDRPHYPHKIISTKVLLNPFTDIVPRTLPKKDVEKAVEKNKSKGTKNFHLLSFGDEAEEDEEETNIVAKEYRGKSKSSHDLANDPNLSSLPAVETKDDHHVDSDEERQNVEKKLKIEEKRKKLAVSLEEKEVSDESDNEQKSKRKKIEEIRKEFKQLKKEMVADKLKENKTEENDEEVPVQPENEAMAEYYESKRKYVESKKKIKANKTTSHEEETIAMLAKFQEKLQSATTVRSEDDEESKTEESKKEAPEEGEDDEDDDEGWLTHTLQFESNDRLAKDANVANEDTFEIYDPRNPINQRRREASKAVMHDKKRK